MPAKELRPQADREPPRDPGFPWWPLAAAAWLAALFAPLALPGRALANRDIALFHLPLRTAFARLAAHGWPQWNPGWNGGQPILSNPNYAAFYPPSWLVLVLPPAAFLSALVVLHAAVAFAGAYRLARRWGCGPSAALLAAVGFTGGGGALSLVSALTLFCSMAWLPWVLAAGDAALRAPAGRQRLRGALWAGAFWALQILNGDPAAVLVSGFGLVCLAAPVLVRDLRTLRTPSTRRLRTVAATLALAVAPVAVALALAAVQWLPTWQRIADSPRAGGLDAAVASAWSAPPERLAELAFPRFYGDPARDQENLYFGWRLSDRDYPYVASIYPGLLLTVLGLAALLGGPLPRRAGLALAVLLGCSLALGRHSPLFGLLRRGFPALAWQRYPEKFVLLALAALVFAAALGWQRLLAERAAGRRQASDLPLALAVVFLATAAALAGLLRSRPQVADWLVRTHGAPLQPAASTAHGVAFLRAESLWALATAALVVLLLAACRSRWPSNRALGLAAVALLAGDLWRSEHNLVRTLPASTYQRPPASLAALLPAAGPASRIYVRPAADGQAELVWKDGDPNSSLVRTQLARLAPYSGTLWGLAYVGNEDYDLLLTQWAQRAMVVLHAEAANQPDLAARFLGAWNVGTLLQRRADPEWLAEAASGRPPQPLRALSNPYLLPRYRFARQVNFHPSFASALTLARRQGYALADHEHCVAPARAPAIVDYPAAPQLLALGDTGARLEVRYRAASAAFFVYAATFDPGWRATVDGEPVAPHPTGIGQIGVEVPAGDHRLVLAYRDPWVPVGAGLSLLALAAWAWALAVLRR